ncbi:calcium uptake protein, mitochondrial-like isoform X2 [Solanum dulcamara]|uniref:calcium uptake protein, mitochondrial-like isoform X2 n=1 Tax=Solanum dulcamara TaxID=45834 RepID=UPI002486458B|nr:calcium uptake protein, mitochondrial-like isoform X2 [Solanum dulcamara]
MPSWLVLRRSPPPMRCMAITQLRRFSHLNGTEVKRDPESTPISFLKWVGGIITSSTLAFACYSYSSYNYPSLSFSDTSQSLDHHQPKYLFGDAYRRKVFFKYEKRIRMRSPPEKVFEYFASFEAHDGEIFMTPADLMRAVVPVFPPSESHLVRDGYLRGERNPGELRCAPSKFFMLFDTNSDGRVSFKEYIFFVTLLSIPESSFSVAFKMFDLDCNGQGAHHSDGLRGGHNLGGHIDSGGLLQDFFGEDGKKRLQYDTFVQFLRDLHEEMLKLEFAHYDYKFRGTISAKDFALSMVASADLKYLNKLLDRVDDIDNEPQLSHIRISFEEFKSFAELRKKLQPFSLALFCFGQVNGLLSRSDFKRAASQVCGVSLTDNMIELVFHVFDTNCDGSLSSDEFIRVLEKRARDIAEPTEAGILNFMSCRGNCTRNYKSYLLSSWSTSC